MPQADTRLSFDQSYKENRAAFIRRLIRNGWTRMAAIAEWERVQAEEDESGY